MDEVLVADQGLPYSVSFECNMPVTIKGFVDPCPFWDTVAGAYSALQMIQSYKSLATGAGDGIPSTYVFEAGGPSWLGVNKIARIRPFPSGRGQECTKRMNLHYIPHASGVMDKQSPTLRSVSQSPNY